MARFPVLTVVAAILTAFAGAAHGQLKTDYTIVMEARNAYLRAHPGLDATIRAAIAASELRHGMTPAQVIAAWGRPYRKNTFSNSPAVEWVFRCDYPHACIPNRRRSLLDDDPLWPRAYFYKGRLSDWRR